jgi:hypothetical protein
MLVTMTPTAGIVAMDLWRERADLAGSPGEPSAVLRSPHDRLGVNRRAALPQPPAARLLPTL